MRLNAERQTYLTILTLWGLLGLLAACESAPTATPPQVVMQATPIMRVTLPAPATPTTVNTVNAPTSTATHTPTATSSPAPTASPVPQPPTATPTLTPTPAPTLKRLTSGGCCTQPFWSPDSKQILFIDKPNERSPTGFYTINAAQPATPQLFSERIAAFTNDFQYATYVADDFAIVEQVDTGQQWRIRTGGRPVLLSPDRTQVVWNETPQNSAPNDARVTTVMGANRDGSEARPITSLLRGGSLAWLSDTRLLVSARLQRDSQELTLFALSLVDGNRTELAKSERLRGTVISPNGAWVAYQIAFDTKAPQDNGLWLAKTDGSAPRKLAFFGPVQWRDAQRFIYVPLETNVTSHAFYEYDTRTSASRRLTDPKVMPFKIANGDWNVSPDGTQIVFLNAQDFNLWLWTLSP